MKDNVKIYRVEGKTVAEACLKFLKKSCVTNLYLYEGIGIQYPRFFNYCIIEDGEISGVMHTKDGYSIHLFLLPGISAEALEKTCSFVRKNFPELRNVFCDSRSLSLFSGRYGEIPRRVRRFISMSVEKVHFNPVCIYSCCVPSPGDAMLFVPLQVDYEVEEVGSDPSEIDPRVVLRVIEKRLKYGEITAIYDMGMPVAMAGLNARFGDSCQIGSVYVKPSYRGKGFGLSVVSGHVKRLFNRYTHVLLFVDEKNDVAKHIYDRLGFRAKGVLVQASFFIR
ncbi:MAG: GNAT family N-acetyltransferase [Spirochaetota bacterium]